MAIYIRGKRDKLKEKLSRWIDEYVIADNVIDTLTDENGKRPTLKQAKKVWLNILYNLADYVRDNNY